MGGVAGVLHLPADRLQGDLVALALKSPQIAISGVGVAGLPGLVEEPVDLQPDLQGLADAFHGGDEGPFGPC